MTDSGLENRASRPSVVSDLRLRVVPELKKNATAAEQARHRKNVERIRLACTEWHYARVLPTGKLFSALVFEDDVYKGVVIFSRGASPWLGTRNDLDQVQICELTRVALLDHDAPVSKIVAIALRILKKTNPGLRLVISFADPSRDHYGGIYQAGNWVYTGKSNDVVEHFVRGRWRHTRGAYHEQKGREDVPHRTMPGKFRYEMGLDAEMRALVELRRQPYPKAVRVEA